MSDNQAQSGENKALTVQRGKRFLRLPNESTQAYEAFRAYLEVPPMQRSVAAAYRKLKGIPDGQPVKVPGHINLWAKQYIWKEREADWDDHIDALTAIVGFQELQEARKQTVEQAISLQTAIETELEAVHKEIQRNQNRPGGPVDQSDRLANLAAALESAARARLMALGGNEFDRD